MTTLTNRIRANRLEIRCAVHSPLLNSRIIYYTVITKMDNEFNLYETTGRFCDDYYIEKDVIDTEVRMRRLLGVNIPLEALHRMTREVASFDYMEATIKKFQEMTYYALEDIVDCGYEYHRDTPEWDKDPKDVWYFKQAKVEFESRPAPPPKADIPF